VNKAAKRYGARHLSRYQRRESKVDDQPELGEVAPSWTTCNARTRFHLFWQEDGQGTHLLAEWRELK
jgi:hypothetical protein